MKSSSALLLVLIQASLISSQFHFLRNFVRQLGGHGQGHGQRSIPMARYHREDQPSLVMIHPQSHQSQALRLNMSEGCMYDAQDLETMGDAVQRALNFFEQNVQDLVLDAAVGTRSLQAQLEEILARHPSLPLETKQFLTMLQGKAKALTNRIAQAIRTTSRISDTEKQHTLPWVTTPGLWDWPVDGIWEPMSVMQSFEPVTGSFNASQILATSRETIEEHESDACIFQVFNCDREDVTDTCRRLFFQEEQSLYSLTHQVIYTLFAKKKQCFRAMSPSQLRKYQEKLCGKVWLEANAIAELGIPSNRADLFVEQIAICGMTGFPNFFRRDWLMQMLKWQSTRTSGCFLDPRVQPPSGNSVAALVSLYHQNQRKFQQLMNQHLLQYKVEQERNKVTSRQKRSDAFLRQGGNENCSVHFTAVGITALGMHIRYFIDTCFPQ